MFRFARCVRAIVMGFLLLTLCACSATPSGSPAESAAADAPASQVDTPTDAVEQSQTGSDEEPLGDAALWQWQAGAERWSYQGEVTVPEVPAGSWVFEEDAIRLTITASNQLNTYDGAPHTLVLRVLQLNGRLDFRDDRKTRAGIRQLLVSDSLETLGASVVAFSEMVVRPGATITRVFDRTAETRFIAIVAGYYDLNREQVTRFISFPAIDDTVEVEPGLLDQLTLGLFENEGVVTPRRPGRLAITLDLASDKIGRIRVETQ